MRRRVDFPAPFGPTRPMRLPGGTTSVTSRRTSCAEWCFVMLAAARVPLLRFRAAAQLGRIYIDGGDISTGIEWLERAVEAPAPTLDEGHAVLYALAAALETHGESARALAILMELDVDAGDYRDVRDRIAQLTRTQTGSHRG